MNRNIRSLPGRRPVLALLLAAALAGCSNMAPVRDFARETQTLSQSFEPMLAGSHSSCMERYQRRKMLTTRQFDAWEVEKSARVLCEPVAESNRVVAQMNDLLHEYAEVLQALAEERQPLLQKDVKGLRASLAGLPGSEGEDAMFDDEQLDGIAGLAEFIASLATRHYQRQGIRELLQHQQAVETLVDGLDEYASVGYMSWLADEKRDMQLLRGHLDQAAASEPLASSWLKVQLLEQQKRIEAREQAVMLFSRSVSEFKRTNREIRERFEQLDNQAVAARLRLLARDVRNLRKAVQAAF